MTLTDLIKQAQELSPSERAQLLLELHAMQDQPLPHESRKQEEHWGKILLRLLDEMESIELDHPEIEDPVEWVKQIRHDESRQRLANWGEEA